MRALTDNNNNNYVLRGENAWKHVSRDGTREKKKRVWIITGLERYKLIHRS